MPYSISCRQDSDTEQERRKEWASSGRRFDGLGYAVGTESKQDIEVMQPLLG
ncbi:hypothetical protein [Vibrio sp. 10N.261.51.F12]|uniref:hypothetical protein n=1 Tax=Vibrio sp. 10N.261.51.F12 TaxID=3229679 RepID=UPI00354ED1F1